jgi:hypothetical protein
MKKTLGLEKNQKTIRNTIAAAVRRRKTASSGGGEMDGAEWEVLFGRRRRHLRSRH